MSNFETQILSAIAAHDIPGCVLVASNRDGSFHYTKPFGSTSMKPENAEPLQLSTTMWIASCTKLLTSLCCLQLVERDLLSLDLAVYPLIPELASFTVLSGFDDDGHPIEKKHTKIITLRLLLTHASGLTYDTMHPNIIAWRAHQGRKPATSGKLLKRFNTPLMFEPGTGWAYGPGIDYAGLLVERVTGLSLEAYMQTNLFDPLGVRDITFFLSRRPDLAVRMADMAFRDASGKVRYTGARMTYQDGEKGEVQDCMGGQGCFASAEAYGEVLRAVLVDDEREVILKKGSWEEFFRPQLGSESRKALNALLLDDMANDAMGGTSQDVEKDWGLGGLLIMGDTPEGMRAGTTLWGGLPNLTWWVDRKAGLCGLYAGQVLPPGDTKCAVLTRGFEEGMYELYAQSKKGKKASNASRL